MKKLGLILVITINSIVFSQTKINHTNFNYNLLEKLVIEKINNYRDSLKLKTLYTSHILRESFSCITASINAKQDKLYHVPYTTWNKDTPKLYNELYNLTNGKCGSKNPSVLLIVQRPEIIQSFTSLTCTTYEELADRMLRCWLNSKGHKAIIELLFDQENVHGPAGISCCVKKSITGIYYVAVGFIQLGYLNV